MLQAAEILRHRDRIDDDGFRVGALMLTDADETGDDIGDLLKLGAVGDGPPHHEVMAEAKYLDGSVIALRSI